MEDNSNQICSFDKSAKEWGKLVNQLSHLLCTKVATLRLKEVWLQKYLPSLQGQEGSNSHSSGDIEQMMNLSLQLIPIMELLKRTNDYIHEIHSDQFLSVRELITSCIEAYPSSEQDLMKVELDSDHEIKVSPVIMASLVKYLLERSLHSISQRGEGNLNIWLSSENNRIALHFRDTGLGLTGAEQNHIFDRFVLMDNENTIKFSLGFFRLAMWNRGNDILCDAVPNEYTHFTILFADS